MPEEEADEHIGKVKQLVTEMKNLHCNICGLKGHISAYCWFNNQLYGLARSKTGDPTFQHANAAFRIAMKTREQMKFDRVKAVFKAESNAHKARMSSEISALKARRMNKPSLRSYMSQIAAEDNVFDMEAGSSLAASARTAMKRTRRARNAVDDDVDHIMADLG